MVKCILRSSLYIAHLPLRNILAPHVYIYIVFFTFQMKIQFIPCQASAFISLVRRGSVILRGISLLGQCAMQPAVDSDQPGRVRGLLPGAAGGAGERGQL